MSINQSNQSLNGAGNNSAGESSAAPLYSETSENNEKKKKRSLNGRRSTIRLLETYRLVLRNVNEQPQIAEYLANVGFSAEVMELGKKRYDRLLNTVNRCKKETGQKLATRRKHDHKWEMLRKKFSIHRDKANYAFRENDDALHALALHENVTRDYLLLIARMKSFYTTILEDEGMKQALAQMGLTDEEINGSLSLLSEVEELRAIYLIEKAESQDATEKKNLAYREADLWMRDFFTIARIAVRESPQLQEAFGKIIKN